MRRPTLRSAALTATALLWLIQPAAAATAERTSFPRLELAEADASGQRAIDLLGSRLDEVAAWYRRSPQAFREMLLRDPLMRLDRHGRLYAVDELEAPLIAPAEEASLAATATPTTLDKTFKLHSLKGAKRMLYLDFNGATLTGTAWNSNGNTLTAQPFDMDGNPGTFSDAELERIQYIWQRVAEDYAPFGIDVTTQEPAADKLTRASTDDQIYGSTVVITNNSGVYNCSCGGVAYVGVFDNVGDFYKPALVFWNMLGPSGEKYVAEAISHEAGHNLGLSHDGNATSGYDTGHGSGATGWAPIMGVGYYQPVTQWSIGEYSSANNQEDDLAVIAANGGTLRKDDHGNTTAKATPLTVTANGVTLTVSGQGVIEQRGDKDVFSFTAGAGPVSITVSPDSRAPNLDVLAKLIDANGTLLLKSNPADALGATLSFALPAAGTYYLLIDGIGFGDPLTNGYSDYASIGQYKISGTAPAP